MAEGELAGGPMDPHAQLWSVWEDVKYHIHRLPRSQWGLSVLAGLVVAVLCGVWWFDLLSWRPSGEEEEVFLEHTIQLLVLAYVLYVAQQATTVAMSFGIVTARRRRKRS